MVDQTAKLRAIALQEANDFDVWLQKHALSPDQQSAACLRRIAYEIRLVRIELEIANLPPDQRK